MVKAMTIII